MAELARVYECGEATIWRARNPFRPEDQTAAQVVQMTS
jgi:hypothetical protein